MNWRSLLARLPLPTLALAASWGVWRFQLLFTPWYVALISAASFELCYLGLSVAQLDGLQRRRATAISVGAVVVSVLYNSLSALFEVRPTLLLDRPLWADVALAVLHGLPLAVVAYLVADLLLHSTPVPGSSTPADDSSDDSESGIVVASVPLFETPLYTTHYGPARNNTVVDSGVTANERTTPAPASKSARVKALAQERGVSESTIWRQLKEGVIAL